MADNGSGIVPGEYMPRIADAQIDTYLKLFGAVEVSGTKWCGKTWTSLAHARSVTYVDRGANLQICSADPEYALAGETPHVIDEWQRVPAIWDTVRHGVDNVGGKKGLWILTGSSTPKKDETSHSGAGRIGSVRMHPMTLQESGDSTGAVSLAGLFEGDFTPAQCPNGIEPLAQLACRGGWPDAIKLSAEDVRPIIRGYLDALHDQSIPVLGGSPLVSRRLCASLARSLGQSATLATLAKDVYALEDGQAPTASQEREVSEHLALLTRMYLVDEVPGWVPASRSPARMRVKPKRYFADPSLAVSLLGLSPKGLLEDWQTFGLVFENLCMRDLDVYARAIPDAGSQPVRYYHDDSNLEVDAIVELSDGRWGAFEMKLSQDKVDKGAASLLRMRAKLAKDRMQRVRAPAFLAVLTGMGEAAYRRSDGVYVIPIRSLGA